MREPGASLIEKFTGADDDTTARFHAIITDLVGTPTELVTAAGALAWQHRTTLWGTDFPTGASPSTVDCPLRFPSQYADPETGLYYNYFRHYDPEAARYVTPDPLGLDPAPNHHVYVVNPMAWLDPRGLSCTKRPDLSVNEKQFGKKWGKHAQDYSLDPADGSSRTWFRDRMSAIHTAPDEVRQGPWNPQSGGGEDYLRSPR
ncbi:RHS repeat-associated core domain-containing protein [Streptomyces asiaticus]